MLHSQPLVSNIGLLNIFARVYLFLTNLEISQFELEGHVVWVIT